MRSINWKEILLFFFIATAVSAPFRLNVITLLKDLDVPGGLNIFFFVLKGIGPLVAYLMMYYIVKSKTPRPNTLFGKDRIASIIAISVIPIGLTVIGLPNENGLNENYFGLIYGLMLALYALGEEYGWRGYLQQALEPLPVFVRLLVITTFWYTWHLNFLIGPISVQGHVIHFFSLLAGSWGLLRVTDVTRSILFAGAVHLSFNLFADVPGDFNKRLYVLIAAGIVWAILLRKISRKSATSTN